MQAIVKLAEGYDLRTVDLPRLQHPHDVVIRVAYAGICRTDVAVAEGRIATRTPLILGHEFSGVVDQVGSAVTRLAPGDRVTAMPVHDCGACLGCREKLDTCEFPSMLGVEHDGAFAESVRVPERLVYEIPDHLDLQTAAYTEPVAACLAVAKAAVSPGQRGAVVGSNRIAELTRRVLHGVGYSSIEMIDPVAIRDCETSSLDFVVETSVDTDLFRELVRVVRPRGRIVLKSRTPERVGIYLPELLRKELSLEAVNYGSFQESVDLLAEGSLAVRDLFGACYPLALFRSAFESERGAESKKIFLRPDTDCGD